MKFTLSLLIIASQAAAVFGAAVSEAAAECGSLGVMPVPAGADPANYRKCLGHPLGHTRTHIDESLAPLDAIENNLTPETTDAVGSLLRTRACWSGSPYGCEKNFCWKVCGDKGEWCWTAHNGGTGAWKGCSNWGQCSQKDSCGGNCNCK